MGAKLGEMTRFEPSRQSACQSALACDSLATRLSGGAMTRRRAIRALAVIWVAWSVMKWWFHGAAPAELLGTAIIIALIAYEVWIQPRLKERRRRLDLENTFAMTFDDDCVSKIVSVGIAQIDVNILIRHSTAMDQFNFRFIT